MKFNNLKASCKHVLIYGKTKWISIIEHDQKAYVKFDDVQPIINSKLFGKFIDADALAYEYYDVDDDYTSTDNALRHREFLKFTHARVISEFEPKYYRTKLGAMIAAHRQIKRSIALVKYNIVEVSDE